MTCFGQLCARRLGSGLGAARYRPSLVVMHTYSLLRDRRAGPCKGGMATQALTASEPAAEPTPMAERGALYCDQPDAHTQPGRTPGRRRMIDALEDRPFGSWLLSMIGLGAARSFEAAGTIGVGAAAAERSGSYRRARTFAKHASDGTSWSGQSNAPARRRRKANSAWLDPLD